MPLPSFHEWLQNRPEEAPAADSLSFLIARPAEKSRLATILAFPTWENASLTRTP